MSTERLAPEASPYRGIGGARRTATGRIEFERSPNRAYRSGGTIRQSRQGGVQLGSESPFVSDRLRPTEIPGTFRKASPYVQAARQDQNALAPLHDLARANFQGRVTGPIQFFDAILQRWKLTISDAAIVLGFETEEPVKDLLTGTASLHTRDAKDRIRLLFDIHESLSGLLQNAEAEQQWLRENQNLLDGHSCLSLILEGSMANLLLVKQYLDHLSGR